jgi:hypothetical protein
MFLYLQTKRVIRVHKWNIKTCVLPSARTATAENIAGRSVQWSFVLQCNAMIPVFTMEKSDFIIAINKVTINYWQRTSCIGQVDVLLGARIREVTD